MHLTLSFPIDFIQICRMMCGRVLCDYIHYQLCGETCTDYFCRKKITDLKEHGNEVPLKIRDKNDVSNLVSI